MKECEQSLWWLNLTSYRLNPTSHKLDLTKIIFFISDWTKHLKTWKLIKVFYVQSDLA